MISLLSLLTTPVWMIHLLSEKQYRGSHIGAYFSVHTASIFFQVGYFLYLKHFFIYLNICLYINKFTHDTWLSNLIHWRQSSFLFAEELMASCHAPLNPMWATSWVCAALARQQLKGTIKWLRASCVYDLYILSKRHNDPVTEKFNDP